MRQRQPRRVPAALRHAALRAIPRDIETLESRRMLTTDYFNLSTGSLSQNWEDSSQITVDDNWSGVASITGYRGDDITTATGVDPQTLTGDSTVVDINHDVNTVAPAQTPGVFNTGGLAEFALATPIGPSGNNTVAFQGSGTADAPFIALYLNGTGRQNITINYDLIDIDDGAVTAGQPVALQYRLGGSSGTWTNVPAGFVAEAASTTSGQAGKTTAVSAVLPADANNAAQIEVRIMTTNAVGNDQMIAVDNIVASSTPAANGPGAISFNPANINVLETAGTKTITLTRSGNLGAVSATYTITPGTASSPADFNGPGGTLTGTVNFANGVDTASFDVSIVNDALVESAESFTIALSNPTGGATIGVGNATVTIADDDTPVPGTIAFNPSFLSVNESAGTATLTVKRTVGTGGAVSATYTITPGTASAPADFNGPGGTLTGTVNFANGADTATIVLSLVNDLTIEQTEQLQVTLSAPTGGATLGPATTATVQITDNDGTLPTGLLINELSIDTASNNTPFSFLELRGTPNTTLGGVFLVSVEGDTASNAGTVSAVLDLSTAVIGSNGILLIKAADVEGFEQGFAPVDPASGVFKTSFLSSTATGFQVGSNSFLLVYRDGNGAALPTNGTDLDAENVAVDRATDPKLGLEGLPSSVTLLDAIAVSDGGVGDVVYGPSIAALAQTGGPGAADLLIRNLGNTNAFDASAFFGGTFTGTSDSTAIGEPSFGTIPVGATLTPGGVNPGTAVVDTTPPTVTSVTFSALGSRPTATVNFSEDVRNTGNGVAASDFTLVNNTTGATIPSSSFNVVVAADGKSATVTFSNVPGAPASPGSLLLPNGNYTLTVLAGSIADLAGNTLASNATGNFRFVNADIVGAGGVGAPDGTVGFDDLVRLAQNYGQSPRTFAQGDVNYNGTVDFDDLVLLAQNYGVSLPLFEAVKAPVVVAAPATKATVGKKSFGSTVIS